MTLFKFLFCAALFTCNFSCNRIPGPVAPRLQLRIFDVGQGDAALLVFPNGQRLLVDAGPDSSGLDTLLQGQGITTIDEVAITHAHADHYGGLRQLLGKIKPRRLLLPGRTSAWTPEFLRLVRYIADTLAIDTLCLTAGASLSGYGTGKVQCLWPDLENHPAYALDSLNAFSLVLRIDNGSGSILMAGDINFDSESDLIAKGALSEATLLKVPHHGSATSTSSSFLSRVRPRLSLISAGFQNDFGHPADLTLTRLAQCGSRVMRTDKEGTLCVEMDSEGGVF
jgi:competence protein ComEC